MSEAGLGITDQYHQFILDPNGNVHDSHKSLAAEGVDAQGRVDFERAARRTAA
ncbi:MAG TPA: hypothetical protein VMY37_00595 [Thermoguttaceae bacterium]|nr:hypothetical protein [Thermoguttaceae bacterium]